MKGRPMGITRHAIERYVSRIAPGTSEEDAARILADASAGAIPTGERTDRGQPLWDVPDGNMRLVTKHDVGAPVPVVVTVLAIDDDLGPRPIPPRTRHMLARLERSLNVIRGPHAHAMEAVAAKARKEERACSAGCGSRGDTASEWWLDGKRPTCKPCGKRLTQDAAYLRTERARR